MMCHLARVAAVLVLVAFGCDAGVSEPVPAPRSAAPAPTSSPRHAGTPRSRKARPSFNVMPGVRRAAKIHYLEAISGGAAPDARLPMVIGVHGLGDEPKSFLQLFRGLSVPARIIAVRGFTSHGSGWSWFPFRTVGSDVPELAKGIDETASQLAHAVRVLSDSRPTHGKPIVTGFSQGGILSFALATHHPDLFAAAYPVGGWLPPPLWPKRSATPRSYPPILALHGSADAVIPVQPTRDAVAHLKATGFAVQLHEYPGVKHAVPRAMRAELHSELEAAIRRLNSGVRPSRPEN